MKRAALVMCLVAPWAFARPWNGIEPGVSKKADVLQKFGQPTKSVPSGAKEILAFMGPNVIKGTSQAQFKVDTQSQVVERIDVFPGPTIDKDTIEGTYGKECPPGTAASPTCYVKRLTDDFKMYFQYGKIGFAVFFNEDGKTVQSFIFTATKQPAKSAPPSAPSQATE